MAGTGFKSRSDHRSDRSSDENTKLNKPEVKPETARSTKPLGDDLEALENNFYSGRNAQAATGTAPDAPADAPDAHTAHDTPDQEARFQQLKADADANPEPELSQSEAAQTGSDASSAGKANYAQASRDKSAALKQGRQTQQDAKSSLDQAGSATGLNMNRPLSPADKQKFSTPAERSALPAPAGDTPFAKHRGAGGAKGAAASGGKRLANYLKRHPRGMIWGAVSLVGVIISIIVAIISLPFQLINMAKNLLDHNFDAGNKIEQKVSRRVMSRLFQEKKAANGGATKATGHPISDKIANMKMDRFNSQLARDGLKLEFDSSGRLTGIHNLTDGKVLTDLSEASFAERRTAIGDLVSERIAPWRVLKRVSYTKVMKYHARVSFRFWPKEKVSDILKVFADKVLKGASPDELVTDNPKSTDPANAGDGSSQASGAVKAVMDEFAKSGSKVKAIRAGAAVFLANNSKVFGITGVIALACTFKEMADAAAEKGYADRAMQLMRTGNMIPTMVSQLYTGKDLDIDKFGQTMAVFTGDPNAPKGSLDRKGWDQSAAAKRINGDTVITNDKSPNYNPDLSEASNPDGFMLQKIVDHISQLFSFIPGSAFGCKLATGLVGMIIGGVEFIAEALTTGGAADAAALAAKTAAMVVVQAVVLPKLLAAAASLAITGTENSVDAFNNSDAGLRLSAEEYHRSYGGRRLSNGEQVALENAARQDNVQIAKQKGWFYRVADLSNNHSVASSLLMKVPTNSSTMVAAITSLPQTLTANLGAIFFGNLSPSYAATTTDINPYEFQFYGFTQAEIDKYPDPIANEDYLAQPVPGQPADGGKTRLSVLGDSSAYSPESGDDPNADDLMHCFVNAFRAPEKLKDDSICGNIGLVTARGGSVGTNPGNDVVKKIYDKAGLNATIDDDFERYRMQLFYTHVIRGLECASNDQDCFKGAGASAAIPATPGANANVADLFTDSTAIACAPGTNDLGIQDGYHAGTLVKIRICGVANLPGNGQESTGGFGVTGANGATVVNSRVSGQVFAMADAMKKAGLNITTSSAFRTMAHQQSLCPCDGVRVAIPGNSNHQMGLAMDFGNNLPSSPGPIPGNPLWDWLSSNAAQFGFSNYPAEAWHWSADGH